MANPFTPPFHQTRTLFEASADPANLGRHLKDALKAVEEQGRLLVGLEQQWLFCLLEQFFHDHPQVARVRIQKFNEGDLQVSSCNTEDLDETQDEYKFPRELLSNWRPGDGPFYDEDGFEDQNTARPIYDAIMVQTMDLNELHRLFFQELRLETLTLDNMPEIARRLVGDTFAAGLTARREEASLEHSVPATARRARPAGRL